MMSPEERALINQLIEKVNRLEKRLVGQETTEAGSGTYSDEAAQDAVGGILTDSTTIDFTYSDVTPLITADVKANAITFDKMLDIATDSLIGRDTAGTGDPATILLNATLSMDGANNLQRAALTGDVTASAGSNTTAIANDAVSNAKANDMAANTVKSNITGSTADPADNDIATVLAQYIHAATGKTPPVDADELALIDSAASNVLKKLTWANLKATVATYYNSLAATLTNKTLDSTNISTLTAKNPPVDADSVVLVDSAASNVFKAVTGTNLKAYLKTYLDTLYGLLASANTWTGAQTFTAGQRSGTLTLAQDTATSITPGFNHCVILIYNFTGGGSGYTGMARTRQDASPSTIAIFSGANFALTTGVLTGTTGAVSTLTVSPHTDGKIYIENRRALSQTFQYTLL